MTLRASVVVPTCGRPEFLDRCLAALVAQDMAAERYEIIVVDDAASDATRSQVERWSSGGPPVRYLHTDGVCGPAAARNLGWRAANGEIIAFTDDDCVPEPGWLRAGLAAFIDGVAGVSGRIIVPLQGIPTDYERNASRLAHSEFVTANCFYRRTALVAAGGFDERFALAWREDTDVYFTLLRNGARLVRQPEATVVHSVRPSPWGVSLRQQRKSMFNALLFKKHPDLYRRHIQPAPPWSYYAIDLSLLGIAAGLTGRRPRIAGIAATIWALLTARFCCRRLRDTSRAPGHVLEMIATSIVIPPLSTFWRLRGSVKFRVPFL